MRALVPIASIAVLSIFAACGPSSGGTSSDGGTGGDWQEDTGGTGSTINSWGGGDNAGAGGITGTGGNGGSQATGGMGGSATGGGAGTGSSACSGATAATVGSNSGDTSTGSSALSSSCVTAGGKEQIFSFVPAASGTLTVTVTPATSADLGVYVFTNCSDESGSELLCANAAAAGVAETGSAPVTSGVEVFIAVDSATDSGAFALDVTVN